MKMESIIAMLATLAQFTLQMAFGTAHRRCNATVHYSLMNTQHFVFILVSQSQVLWTLTHKSQSHLTKLDYINPTCKKIIEDVEHLTAAETNVLILKQTTTTTKEKQLQCLRCKQLCHCIPVTLKVGILLKVKQSSDNLDNRSYY